MRNPEGVVLLISSFQGSLPIDIFYSDANPPGLQMIFFAHQLPGGALVKLINYPTQFRRNGICVTRT